MASKQTWTRKSSKKERGEEGERGEEEGERGEEEGERGEEEEEREREKGRKREVKWQIQSNIHSSEYAVKASEGAKTSEETKDIVKAIHETKEQLASETTKLTKLKEEKKKYQVRKDKTEVYILQNGFI